jgi:aminoglycoside phosphotransferase (APT) family kinase protein
VLSPADGDLVARDPGLPGLATLLDPDAFLEAVRQAAPGARLERARPRYVRYKRGTNCLVAYRLEGQGAPIDVYAKAHGRDAPVKLDKAAERRGAVGALGCSRFAIADRGLVVSVFPNDSKLAALACLGDPTARRRLLSRILPRRQGLWDGALQTLRYKPERRYVARLAASDGEGVALKLYTDGSFAQVRSIAKRYASRGRLRLPQRIGKRVRHAALALEWIEGESLPEAIAAGRGDACARVGEALAQLHADPGLELPLRSRQADAELATELAGSLATLWPPHGRRAAALAARIAADLPRDSGTCLVHGDFYDRQVILCEDRVAILDLDRAVHASPFVDLGSFAARLLRHAALGELAASRVREALAGLLEGYQAASGARIPDGLAAYTALALLQLAAEPFREHAPEWPDRIAALLGCAEAVMAGAAAHS